MADSHLRGGPSCLPPANTQETTASFTEEDLETRTTTETGNEPVIAMFSLHQTQTTAIAATQNSHPNEPQEIKHNQHAIPEQSEKLHEVLKALRAQIETTPPVTATRTWATIAAEDDNRPFPPTHLQLQKRPRLHSNP